MTPVDAYAMALAAMLAGFLGGWGWCALRQAYRAKRARDEVADAIAASLKKDPRAVMHSLR